MTFNTACKHFETELIHMPLSKIYLLSKFH